MNMGDNQRNTLKPFIALALFAIISFCAGCKKSDNDTQSPASKEWSKAEQILLNNTRAADYPQIAMDAGGNAMAVWELRDSSRKNIWASYFDGSSWSTPQLIETGSAGDAENPQVAMDADGNAIAVWSQYDGYQFSIYANHFDGDEWSTEFLIESRSSDSARNPMIAMNSNGAAIVAWEQIGSSLTNIWANYFDGADWGTAVQIESGDADSPQVAIDNDGYAMVVWTKYETFPYDIWAKYFDGETWNTAKSIDASNNGSGYYPQVAMDGAGNAIAVWQQYDSFRYNIWANYFDVDALEDEDEDEEEDTEQWSMAEYIETDNSGNAQDPQIVMDDNGNAMAVWRQYDGSKFSIYANYFDGVSWGTAELLEDVDDGDSNYPQIAMNENGTAMAVWQQYDGLNNNIWANYFDGVSWGTAELLEYDDEDDNYDDYFGDADSPQIAINSNGNAVAVWVQFDGDQFSIFANRFEPQ